MKLLTWNWNGGDKLEAASSIGAEIGCYQEVPKGVAEAAGIPWFGDHPAKGVAVVSESGYSVGTQTQATLPRFVIPMKVRGRHEFQLINVWTKDDGRDRYVRGLVRAVDRLSGSVAAEPTVIIGDFNANAQWDGDYPKNENFSALAKRLADLGLVSAYHEFFGESPGHETRPTFHMNRRENRPYHIDYCFIPTGWLPRLRSVTVGTRADWCKWSDHVPLVVEIDL